MCKNMLLYKDKYPMAIYMSFKENKYSNYSFKKLVNFIGSRWH